ARADAVEDLGHVARADLAHLDAGAELASQVADELAEVHALLGVEVDGRAARARREFHVDDLHGQPMLARLPLARDDGALLALAPLAPLADLGLGRRADDALIRTIAFELGQRPSRATDLAHDLAGLRAHHHEIAHVHLRIRGGLVVLGLGHLAQTDPDEILDE